jgi:hypothetical protein
MGEMRNACKILLGKPERKGPFGRPRLRGEDNIKTDFREIGFGVGWVGLILSRIGTCGGILLTQ